jgi:hypothetical protein
MVFCVRCHAAFKISPLAVFLDVARRENPARVGEGVRRLPRGAKLQAVRAGVVRLNIYLSAKLRARIDAAAGEQGIRPSQLVRVAIVKYIEERAREMGQVFTYDPPSVRR